MNLTSLDVHYIVEELQLFVGGKIEKITQSDKEKRDVLLTLYQRDVPKTHLRIFLPGLICTYPQKPHYQQVPPGFAMFLRKYIQNARITAVEQRGFDRLLILKLDTKNGPAEFIIELIPPGNIILVLDEKIKGLLENQNYKDRTLRGGIAYEPPYVSFNLLESSEAEILSEIKKSDRDTIVTTLAMTLGLGGVYAEEVCLRASVDKSAGKLSNADLKKVAKAAKGIVSEKILVHKNEKRSFPIKMHGAEAIDGSFLSNLSDYVPVSEAPRVKKDKKLETMEKAQGKNIEKQGRISEESRATGEKIYEEYQIVSEILLAAETARKEKKDIEEVLKKFKQVQKYNKKTQEIELEL